MKRLRKVVGECFRRDDVKESVEKASEKTASYCRYIQKYLSILTLKKQNFKERLANVKLKDIDLWAKENLSPNRVDLRSRTLNKVS
ncbi:MAG: hypothetical protein K2L22_09005 [Muribaculaceae bacterium]|nr:hypothetical protein [Muribaculaceae bacterium]